MDEQAKTIITLFLLLLVLAGVAVAKVTGVFDKEELVMEGTEYVEYSSEELMAIADEAREAEKLKEQQKLQEAAENGDLDTLINSSLNNSEFQNALSSFEAIIEVFSGVAMIIGIITSIVAILTPIINYKLFIKLGLPADLVMWLILGPVVSLVLGFFNILIVSLIWALIEFIMMIRLFLAYIRKLAVNPIIPLAIVIGFVLAWIPVNIIAIIGALTVIIAAIIFNIDTTNVTGKMFGKSVAYRVGMFFLTPIFNGKLAFDHNEVVIMSALEARENKGSSIRTKSKSNVRSMSEQMSKDEEDDGDDFLIFEEIDGEKVSDKTGETEEFDELEEMTKVEEDKTEEPVDLPVFSRASKKVEDKDVEEDVVEEFLEEEKVEEEVNDLPVFSRASKEDKKIVNEVEEIESMEELEELEKIKAVEEDKVTEEESDLPVFSRISKTKEDKKEEDKVTEEESDLPVFSRISKSTDNKKTNKE